MSNAAKSPRSPLTSARQSLPDSTDPNAGARRDDDLAVNHGVDDKTQIIDASQASGPPYKIIVLAGPKAGTEFNVENDLFTVGRAVDNIISIPDVSVSRKHSQFQRTDTGFIVTDLKSGNGTKVNGVNQLSAAVGHGDEVTLGDTVLQFIDLTKPVPERLKPINTLRAPTGHTGNPAVTTEVEGARLLPIRKTEARMQPVPAASPAADRNARPDPVRMELPKTAPPGQAFQKEKVTSAARQGGSNTRVRIYIAIGAVMIIAIVAAKLLLPQATPGAVTTATTSDDIPPQLAQARDKVAKDHDWAAAERILAPIKDSKNPEVVRWLQAVPRERGFQTKLEGARAMLDRFDFDNGRQALLSIPSDADVYPLAQAELASFDQRIAKALDEGRQALQAGDRQQAVEWANRILLVQPQNDAARSLKEEASKPAHGGGGGEAHHREARAAPPPPPPPAEPKSTLPFAGPWLTAYLNNNLKDALRQASGASDPSVRDQFAGMLRDFSANYSQGMQLAEGKHTLEALKYLQSAMRIDQQIMAKRENQIGSDQPGHEVRKQIGNIEYLLSLDSRSEDTLPTRAKHLRNALAADPENELAKKALNDSYVQARNLFMNAYVQKGQQPQEAMRQFRIVMTTLPADDEKAQKSKYWIEQLGGH